MGATTMEPWAISADDAAKIREALLLGERLETFLAHAKAVLHAIGNTEAFAGLPLDPDEQDRQSAGIYLLDMLEAEALAIDPGTTGGERLGEFSSALHLLKRLEA